jgi:hypothetical protein
MQLGNPASYVQRRVEDTVLHQVLAEYVPAFIAKAEQADRNVPAFVHKELEAMVACGVFEHGLTHWKCGVCGFSRVLPFSCKSRTCSFCGARHMTETAARLVEHIVPRVPVRQWVLSFPPPLRYLLAYDADLLGEALSLFVASVFSFYRQKARQYLGLESSDGLYCGAVTVIQRARSDLALHPHLHAAVFDGAYMWTDPDEKPVFRAVPEPVHAEVAQVAWNTCQQTLALLRRRGKYFDADPVDCDDLAHQEPLLADCYAASVQGTTTIGDRAGQRLLRLRQVVVDGRQERRQEVNGPAHGFNVHAGVRVPAHDRGRLERVLRYTLRPPICNQRLSWTKEGRVLYQLKKRWSDGTTAIIFEPLDFVAKVAALVPRPRHHMVRYHGALAPRSKLRALVVPKSAEQQAEAESGSLPPQQMTLWSRPKRSGGRRDNNHSRPSTPRRLSWAQLLARVFTVDVEVCPQCQRGRMRLVGVVTSPRPSRRC